MRRYFLLTAVLVLYLFFGCDFAVAKKIKNSFVIEKESRKNTKPTDQQIPGVKIELSDSLTVKSQERGNLFNVSFAGYDKEPNSNRESFIIVNPTALTLTGYSVKIDYLDMQGRMLHSRTLTQGCLVPEGESRRIDVASWDTQHTYYYYLGNEPKRVATPFQVTFTPLAYWIETIDATDDGL